MDGCKAPLPQAASPGRAALSGHGSRCRRSRDADGHTEAQQSTAKLSRGRQRWQTPRPVCSRPCQLSDLPEALTAERGFYLLARLTHPPQPGRASDLSTTNPISPPAAPGLSSSSSAAPGPLISPGFLKPPISPPQLLPPGPSLSSRHGQSSSCGSAPA